MKVTFGIRKKPIEEKVSKISIAKNIHTPGFESIQNNTQSQEKKSCLVSMDSAGTMEVVHIGGPSEPTIPCKNPLKRSIGKDTADGTVSKSEDTNIDKDEQKQPVVLKNGLTVINDPTMRTEQKATSKDLHKGVISTMSRKRKATASSTTKSHNIDTTDMDNQQFHKELRGLPQTNQSSYDKMSVEQFGLAMLRGMGFKPYEERNEQERRTYIHPHSFVKRAYQRAGLGADEKVLLPTEKGSTTTSEKITDKKK